LVDLNEGPQGVDLRYSQVYDDIKEARKSIPEENKKPNYFFIKSTCESVLSSQTKDLYILGFYLESLCHINGFEGIDHGLYILNEFLNIFFDSMFPKVFEDDDPMEPRIKILSWIKKMYVDTIPLLQLPASSVTLYDWRLHQRQKISSPFSYYFDKNLITVCQSHLNELSHTIDHFIPCHDLSFKNLNDIFNEILSIPVIEMIPSSSDNPVPKNEHNQHNTPMELSNEQEVSNRKMAYKALIDLAYFLETIDPHSLVPIFVKMAASWENKTLPQVLSSIPQESQEVKTILQLMGTIATQSPPEPPKDKTITSNVNDMKNMMGIGQ
jgi:type VI secretion system protein ImpA